MDQHALGRCVAHSSLRRMSNQHDEESCAAQSGHLPTPGLAGDVIGFDIKTVTPHDQSPRWNMLVAVDFCTRKTWARSMDDKAATLTTVQNQNIMMRCECPKSYAGESMMSFKRGLYEL